MIGEEEMLNWGAYNLLRDMIELGLRPCQTGSNGAPWPVISTTGRVPWRTPYIAAPVPHDVAIALVKSGYIEEAPCTSANRVKVYQVTEKGLKRYRMLVSTQ